MSRPHVSFALALLLSLAAIGCAGRSKSASERLRDAVVGYNDELRFGRTDLAVQRVAPATRSQFVGSHYRWGRGIEIADVEIINVEVAGEDFDRAVSFVSYRWIATGTMLVRETMVRQEWRKERSNYLLVAEIAIDGDASLLSIPEGFRPEASGLIVNVDAGVGDGGVDAGLSP